MHSELARQVVGAALRHSEAHEQAERRRRADQPDRHGLLQDFLELLGAVEREIGDVVLVIRGMDRVARLDRVHEMDLGAGQQLADERDLGQRGTVEMAHAAGPHRAQNARLRIAFDRVENIAGKCCDKAARCGSDRCWPQAHERLRRPLARDHGIDGGQNAAVCGTQHEAGFRHRTNLLRQGGDTRTFGPGDKFRVNAAAERYAPRRQTGVRGLRIACRSISVSLKDAGPHDGRLDRKRRVTS